MNLPGPELGAYVARAAEGGPGRPGRLVVQPRMGMPRTEEMAAGLRAVSRVPARVVGTITLDSYTRIGDHDGARAALAAGEHLNGFPIVAHGPEVTAAVAAAAEGIPVQVRHGSAAPADIFAAMVAAGLAASEGGPVSYCLPYGRVPLTEAVASWRDATELLAGSARARGLRAHLETFGGCMLGQLCPPSLLVALSVLEALFFVQHGIDSVSLSYAQQTHPVQDIEALAALRLLADELLPPEVDRHLVLYTYMGVYPSSSGGAELLLDRSAEVAVRGGAERLIVKTTSEAHRIPTVAENLDALVRADAAATAARTDSALPWAGACDPGEVLAEARAMVEVVLQHRDVGTGLLAAFRSGRLDVPFCLHADNRGETQGAILPDGRLAWANTARLPLRPTSHRARGRLRAAELGGMLHHMADSFDRLALSRAKTPQAVD